MHKVVLWDFHGTLARRSWSETLVEVFDAHEPGHGFVREDFRSAMRDGFPWHDWERPHPELSEPHAWWEHVEALLARAYVAVGVQRARAGELARLARARYADPGAYFVYPDVRPSLERLAEAGWRHVVLSNHVPELPAIVEGLGLGDLFDHVVTSAAIGHEKPHPDAFRIAREQAGRPDVLWMVGDNPVADGWGAVKAGIPAVLVRGADRPYTRAAADLHDAARILLEAQPE